MTPTASARRERALDLLTARLSEAPLNVVSQRDRGRIRERHVRESVQVAAALPVLPDSRWLDLGTGGGLPGLVCALYHPEAAWVLLDATGKKVRFVAALAQDLGLSNVTAIHGRAEVLARDRDHREAFDGVVARAVARLPVLAELARGFLRPGAALHAVKGPAVAVEIGAFGRCRRALRFGTPELHDLGSADPASLLVSISAEGRCPARVPRGDGVPQSQPLCPSPLPPSDDVPRP